MCCELVQSACLERAKLNQSIGRVGSSWRVRRANLSAGLADGFGLVI